MAVHLGSSSTANLVHKWEPSHAYTAGDVVMAPDGTIVQRNADGTSGSVYTGANWTTVAGGGAVASVNGQTGAVVVNEVETVVYSGSVGATRPAADFVVWQGFPTQPTNMLDGDLWLSDLGGTILNGTAAPTSTDGANGDFYIRTSTSMLYGPKAAGAWPSGVSLVGAAGTNGTSGAVVEPTTAPPSTNTTGSVLGTSVNAAHADHTHAVGAHDHTTTAKGGTLPVGALSATGTPSSSTYLRGDNTWGTPAGGGTSTAPNIPRPLTQPTGTISATLDRFAANIVGTALVSGTVYLAPIMLTAGDSLTALRVRLGTVASLTHAWLALCDSTRNVVAVTADDTTANPANNGGTSEYRQYAISSGPYVAPSTGLYIVAACQVGTTVNMFGTTFAAGPVGVAAPLFGSAATGQTTPPTVGSTLAAPTGNNGIVPWVWAV